MRGQGFRSVIIFAVLCAAAIAASADVAPEPGQKRVYYDLIMNADEDFKDFRFFVVSGAKLSECTVKKGLNDPIGPMGGGAYYRSARVYAVPQKAASELADVGSPEGADNLRSALTDGRIPGSIKLIDHSFSRDVAESESGDLEQPIYRILRDPNGTIRAVASDSFNPASGESRPKAGQETVATRGQISVSVIAGGLVALAVVFAGLWFFRNRSSRR